MIGCACRVVAAPNPSRARRLGQVRHLSAHLPMTDRPPALFDVIPVHCLDAGNISPVARHWSLCEFWQSWSCLIEGNSHRLSSSCCYTGGQRSRMNRYLLAALVLVSTAPNINSASGVQNISFSVYRIRMSLGSLVIFIYIHIRLLSMAADAGYINTDCIK